MKDPVFCADSALALWIKWVLFFFFHWAHGEKLRQSLAWNFHKQWKHITQPSSSFLTQNTLYYTLKCLWHKKHTRIPSKGKCHANDTFPTRRGIYCGQDRPEGSGCNQTGTFQQSEVSHSWSEFRDRNTSKKSCCRTNKTERKLRVNLTPPRNWESLVPFQQGWYSEDWMAL